MFPRIHPALREHFTWCERMKTLLANPIMDAMAKRLKLEDEQRAALVAAALNLKEQTR
jgi:hypothetical protein